MKRNLSTSSALAVAILLVIYLVAADSIAQEVQPTNNPSVNHTNPQWSPNKLWIVYERPSPGTGNLSIFKVAVPNPTFLEDPVVDDIFTNKQPRWSPVVGTDGLYWIAFSRNSDPLQPTWFRIHVVDENGLQLRSVSSEPGVPETNQSFVRSHVFPRWSPDGVSLVFDRGVPKSEEATSSVHCSYSTIRFSPALRAVWPPDNYLVSPEIGDAPSNGSPMRDTSMYKPVWSPVLNPSNPAWNWIVYKRESGLTVPPAFAQRKIQRMSVLGDDVSGPFDVFVPAMPASCNNPEWSPAADSIVFSVVDDPSSSTSNEDVYVAPFDGNAATINLTPNSPGYMDSSPVWSPVGDNVAFVRRSTMGGNGQIMIVNVSTLVITEIVGGSADHDKPQWDSTGTELVYQKKIAGSTTWHIFKKPIV